MPPSTRKILPNPITPLRHIQQTQIHIHNKHTLFIIHAANNADHGQCHAGQTQEFILGIRGATRRVDKDHSARVLKRAGCESAFEEEAFGV